MPEVLVSTRFKMSHVQTIEKPVALAGYHREQPEVTRRQLGVEQRLAELAGAELGELPPIFFGR